MQKLEETYYSNNVNGQQSEALNLDWGKSTMKLSELVGTKTSDGRKVFIVQVSIYEEGKESLDETSNAYGNDVYEAANKLIEKIAKVLGIELEPVRKPVVEINPSDDDIEELIVAKPGWVARRAIVLSMKAQGKSNGDIAVALNHAS